MKTKLHIAALMLVFITSCTTEPPNVIDQEDRYGKIFVQSNTSGAAIIVNGMPSGKITPDTVTARAGNAIIRLEKDGYLPATLNAIVLPDSLISVTVNMEVQSAPKVVLLEEFSNVSCVPCVATNRIISKLPESGYSKEKVVIIKYSANYPSPLDPHYQHAKSDMDSRLMYYTVFSTPTLYVDGTVSPVASDSNSIKSALDLGLAKTPKFRITIKDSIDAGEYKISITLQNLDSTGLSFSNLILHTVVTESQITYSSPPGANGETLFKNVARKMLPSKDGEALTISNSMNTVTYSRSIPLHSAWNPANLRCAVFVQNKLTKEVYQASSTY
ncbi:MAG: Omp28-related outer membrane protein [Ignavibacteriaceae bacterium]|nr:Omp28-related outer membrane protein [Ignavibacteriaceae bacterium]